ncbi:MAG: 2-aminoethylphosphonate--pyruvate transaminase [Planctomycetaceae bacterium]|nr:2-aminoethylphosphonate--pyruvate transaminase [Planctomycetaceae bacterium]
MDDDIPYLLLTPGPLTTTRTVREAMLRDYSTWDVDYNSLVNDVRTQLTRLASASDDFTTVLMQGSGTFAVEATVGSVIPPEGCLLVVNNGAYGKRILQIAQRLKIKTIEAAFRETELPQVEIIESHLEQHPEITHVAMVHCETTTGMLNPAAEIGACVKRHGKVFILDAMSSFGGMEMSMESMSADYLISSANKCIQGVPGFGFVISRRSKFEQTQGWARSLSLDLYDQWQTMEAGGGKWRYTSPTHVVRAFAQALSELEAEGGTSAREQRYTANQRRLVAGMRELGFGTLLTDALHSPIITSFLFPTASFNFSQFYDQLKARRFVIYPGKVTNADTFRIGTIGNVHPEDIDELLSAIAEVSREMDISK